MLRTFPFINFICRFFDTIVTKDHRLNFNRSVMLRGRVDTNPNPNPSITLILTLKQYSLNKEIDPDLGPGRDPAFY